MRSIHQCVTIASRSDRNLSAYKRWKAFVSDGPFAETREVLGGYYLILARNQGEAESVAATHPGARVGTVEVRPLFDISEIQKSAKS